MAVYRTVSMTFWTDPKVTDDFTVTDKTLALTKNYVENSIYTAQVGNLDELVRLSGKENSTLVDEVH